MSFSGCIICNPEWNISKSFVRLSVLFSQAHVSSYDTVGEEYWVITISFTAAWFLLIENGAFSILTDDMEIMLCGTSYIVKVFAFLYIIMTVRKWCRKGEITILICIYTLDNLILFVSLSIDLNWMIRIIVNSIDNTCHGGSCHRCLLTKLQIMFLKLRYSWYRWIIKSRCPFEAVFVAVRQYHFSAVVCPHIRIVCKRGGSFIQCGAAYSGILSKLFYKILSSWKIRYSGCRISILISCKYLHNTTVRNKFACTVLYGITIFIDNCKSNSFQTCKSLRTVPGIKSTFLCNIIFYNLNTSTILSLSICQYYSLFII